jgi:GAF domain-containing protein/PAS domain-containing protein
VTPRREPDSSSPASPVTPLTDEAVAPERLMAELANVQVAHEELRVAEEELRVQQDQISQLLVEHETERRWRGQMSALIPVGLCTTDGNGVLTDANPALASLLGAPMQRLHGKPLSVFLSPDDVRRFRSALSGLSVGTPAEHRFAVTVRPRQQAPTAAYLFGFTEASDHRRSRARVQWVMVPEKQPPGGSAQEAAGDGVGRSSEALAATQVIGLASSLAELTALPVGEVDRQRLLSRMAALIRSAVPAAQWVSITLGPPEEPQRLGSDSTEAQDFDGRQVRAAEGPCWTAYRAATVVISADVTADPRWPALAEIAGAGPVRSVLAVPLTEDGTAVGAVNVYSGQPDAFGDVGRRIAELVAAAVAGILQTVAEREAMQKLAANLERALESRAVIDQAKGMIMMRLGVDADDAFARLADVSNRLNIKLRDLAGLVVTGHVDDVLRVSD